MLTNLKKIFSWLNNNKFLVIAVLLVTFLPSIAQAVDIIASVQSAIIDAILKPIVYGLGDLLIFLINLLTYLFEYNDFLTVPVINQGWIVVRDLLNMTFILMMMVMAIATIVPFEKIASYNYKKMMLKMVVAAITINFSKVILGVIIDACQIVMLQFVSSFREAIAVNLADGALLPQILSFSNENASPDNTQLLSIIISLLFAIVFLVIFAFVLLVYGLVLLYRIISLWIIIMLSPLMFFAQVGGPMLSKVSSELWSKFWSQVTIGITLAFFMWLALMVLYMTDEPQNWMTGDGGGQITEVKSAVGSSASGAGEKNACASQACEYYNILRFLIAILMLMQALQYAQKSGGFVGKVAGSVSGKISAFGAGALGGFGAAKYLQGKSKDLGKKAWGGTKALGSTAYQWTAGKVTTGLKNKLGEGGAKGAGLGAAGLAMAATGVGVVPGLALAGYGAAKAFKQAWKNGSKQKNDRRDIARKTKSMVAKDKGKYLDKNGAETDKQNAYAEWNSDKQAYITKETKYKEKQVEVKEGEVGFDANNYVEKKEQKKYYIDENGKEVWEDDPDYDPDKKSSIIDPVTGKPFVRQVSEKERKTKVSIKTERVYENEAEYGALSGDVKVEKGGEKLVDSNDKKRQRFATFDDYSTFGKSIKRRYDENKNTYRKVKEDGEFDEDDKGIELKKTGPGVIESLWNANTSKFIASTDKVKQEAVDKGVSNMEKLDAESLKNVVKNGSYDDRKFAALALAKRGEEMDTETISAAKKAVSSDSYAKKQFDKQMGAAGNTDQFKNKDGKVDVDALAEAIRKKEVKVSEIKASQLNTQVMEAVFRQFGKGASRMFDDIADDVSSKNKLNQVLYEYGNPENRQPNLPNREFALGQYAKRTGNYFSAGKDDKDKNKDKLVMNKEQVLKFFKDNGDKGVLANVSIDSLNMPEMQDALKECRNATLFSNFFRNEDISAVVKQKVADILSECDKDFVGKIRKGPAGSYFRGNSGNSGKNNEDDEES